MADYQTAGTDIFILTPTAADPSVCEVIDLGCVTSIDPGTDSSDQIETTCLRDRTRRYAAGLTTPGQGSVGINADPQNPAHLKMFELSKSKTTIKFAVGWSDGTTVPTAAVAGAVSRVTVTAPGTGYTSAPTVAITGGGGTGATATAVLSGDGVSSVVITNPGTSYTSVPTVAFTGGGGGTGAAATAVLGEGCEFDLPTDRTWNVFEGYVSGFPFNFALNSVVQSDVSIQRSGDNFWYPKA